MSKIKPSSFNYKDFSVGDLGGADIILQNKKRRQGLRYTLIKDTPEGKKEKTVIFHTIFTHLQMLTNKIVKDEETADKSAPYIEDLKKIKDFIPKLAAAEEAGREHYKSQGLLYKIFTVICRIFGKTPYKSTHVARLATLKVEIDQHIANMKAEHNIEIYDEIETIVNKNKDKKQVYINHHKKCPGASLNVKYNVLLHLFNKGKIAGFVILKDRIKIDLVEPEDTLT